LNNEEFLKRHNIKVIDTNKRFARYGPKHFMFTNDVDYNDIAQTMYYETEPLFTVEIPESNLIAMKDFEDQVFNNIHRHGGDHYHMFNTMMEQKQKEKYLKNKHPAVKKAYEHYSLILKLAESGEL
jgi:hypothetical protein